MTHSHISDEDLLAFHWDGDGRSAAHVGECPLCAGRLDELRGLLRSVEDAPVPERDASYGRKVWARLEPRLREEHRASTGLRLAGLARFLLPSMPGRAVAAAGAIAALVVAAFLAGRLVASRPGTSGAAFIPGRPERVLLVDLGSHLDRSESILLELVHAPGDGGQDVSSEQARLSELLPANRLYRQNANLAGDPALSNLLDELERVLLEVQHGPAQLTAPQREALRRRIESEGVLFRLRILSSRLKERERAGAAPAPNSIPERKRA